MPATRASLIERLGAIDAELSDPHLVESAHALELRLERAKLQEQLDKLKPADSIRDPRILRS